MDYGHMLKLLQALSDEYSLNESLKESILDIDNRVFSILSFSHYLSRRNYSCNTK